MKPWQYELPRCEARDTALYCIYDSFYSPDRARGARSLPPLFNTGGIVWIYPAKLTSQHPVPAAARGADGTFRGWWITRTLLSPADWCCDRERGAGYPRSELPIGGWVWQLFSLPPSLLLPSSTEMRKPEGSQQMLSKCWQVASDCPASRTVSPKPSIVMNYLYVVSC